MKKTKQILIACMAIIIAVTGFGSISVQAGNKVKPTKVSIAKSSMSVTVGKKFEINAKVSPKEADDDYLRWEIVSGKKYVKFIDKDLSDDEIELKALKTGKAKIRCYIKGKSKKKYGDTITVTVKKKSANYSLSRVGKATKVIELGDDFELKVKKGSSIKNSQLKWSISKSSIVGFDDRTKTGKEVEFKAKKLGTTKITCTCTNKKAKTKKITYTIKVVPEQDDDDDD